MINAECGNNEARLPRNDIVRNDILSIRLRCRK